ncbi:MAG: polysaccharide deacetylase family protein [Clostridia bacterium]|nr:polysaccharide deacetylase family protein [Clostridia bacterium]
MWNGKMTALTFSFDDAVLQDIRFIEILNKYDLKGTFNLNSGRFGRDKDTLNIGGKIVNHHKVNAADVRSIYEGHEIAAHTIDHPRLPGIADDAEIIRQVEEDRLRLSELAGYEVVGFAYPCGGVNNDDRVAKLIKEKTGIKYCRTITSNYSFDIQENLYRFNPSVYHMEFERMLELGEKFLKLESDKQQLFYIWGHSYEFDYVESWEKFEEFLKMMSGHDDIFYGTNKEVLL